jgi:hypothetical protein
VQAEQVDVIAADGGVARAERVNRAAPLVAARRTQAGPRQPLTWWHATIGNRAVGRLLARERLLARYDTGEHAQFGSDQVVFERGDVKITEAEMVTMGDLYERPEDMYQADVEELRRLVALVRRDKAFYLGTKGVEGVSNREWNEATPVGAHRTKTFIDLANENATHYGPRAGGVHGPDHKSEWERIHRQALDMAHTATTADQATRALAFNGFAAHFLTDAFAAGHLVAKDDVMDRARRSWDEIDTWGWFIKESAFTREAAERVLADPKAGPKLRQYRLRIAAYGEMTSERLSELLYGFSDTHPELFFETFIKMVHDELNHTTVEVDNARGDGPWMLPGDGDLATSPKTLEVGNAAVRASVANLELAHATSGPLDYQKLFARVWAYTPHPTKSGQAHVDDVVARLTDPAHRTETIDAFVKTVIKNIGTVIDELHDPKRNRLATPEELDQRAREAAVYAEKWRQKNHIPIYRH